MFIKIKNKGETMNNRILTEFVAVVVLVAIFDHIFGTNLFKHNIGTIFVVIGLAWFIGSVMGLAFVPFSHSITTIVLSITIAICGGMIATQYPEEFEIKWTEDEMGNTTNAEWQIVLSYKEYGFIQTKNFSFTGTTKEANQAVGCAIEKWNNEHPESIVEDASKILVYIPADYAREHNYPKELAQRY